VSQVAAAASAGVVLVIAAQPSPDPAHTLGSIIAGVAGAIGVVAFYRALAIGAMSVVSPIIAAQVIVPVAVGLAFGERPAALAYPGMALAVGGVALISGSRGRSGGRTPRAAILLAILTAVCFGVMLVGLDVGGRQSPYWAVFDARLASACVILVYFAASRRRLDLTARAVPGLALVGLLLTAANTLFTVAATIGYLSMVSILGSLSPVATTGLAQIILHERLTTRQWIGVALVFAGVVLLSV
jgi:drug/metabolite transporter (DMT)-like permease